MRSGMATIDSSANLITLINVFTVDPDRQDELARLLIEATETTMRHRQGFVSATIHKSLDGKKVVNYAQWRSKEDFEAMQKDPAAIPHMKKAAELATFEPILCEVIESIAVAR
jgi:quinol monooxygenase YgiN